MKLEFSLHILEKYSGIICHENPVESEQSFFMLPERIVVLRNIVDAPKNITSEEIEGRTVAGNMLLDLEPRVQQLQLECM